MLSTNSPEFNLKNKSLLGVAIVTPNPMSNRLVKQKIEKKHPHATNELKRAGAVIYQRKNTSCEPVSKSVDSVHLVPKWSPFLYSFLLFLLLLLFSFLS